VTEKAPESAALTEKELELVKRVAQRDGITEDQAATNLAKAGLADESENDQASLQARLRASSANSAFFWDQEITSYRAKLEGAIKAGRASAESRANAKAAKAKRTSNARSTNVQPTINQEPLTKNQEELKKNTVGQEAPDPLPPRVNGHNREALQGAREVLTFLNEKTGRNYEPVPANLEMIVARLKEGATVTDLRQVVAKKCREWIGDEKMSEFLRPKTLFNRTNFANYKGELINVPG
jgi:uncharacterized phage protein (TIGR02220 family)